MAFPLLAAPPEIRMSIYRHMAKLQRFEYSLHLAQSPSEPNQQVWRLRGPNKQDPYMWSLVKTCKTTYSEALAIFYGSVEIVITLPDIPCLVEPYAAALLRFLPGISARTLRSLIVDIPIDFDTVDNLEALFRKIDFGRHLSDLCIVFRLPTKERIATHIPKYIDMLRGIGTIQPGQSEESARSQAELRIMGDLSRTQDESFRALWLKMEFPFLLRRPPIVLEDVLTVKWHWTFIVMLENNKRFRAGQLKDRQVCAKGYSLP
ncbi:hypothetical protein BDZ85DRAFT_258518 [Elsinoe ampelina]|uniref:Uncharacterized protein n=1 Tax=Elsinoe ampelina TaxID=302913 RepID=A0A6A6GJW9_9PEZI|nr:hypothetical protein BDZ85DRAFT_258518 [Elsinoe ampelina]